MLIVAHGLGRSPAEWSRCARALDPDAIVPDLPMLRRDDVPPDHGAAIAAMLAALGEVPSATWLGHSGGAHVALEAAIEYPDRVDALVLVAAAPARAYLERVRCDVLVVLGERDGIVMNAVPDYVAIETIAGAGHDPHLEAMDELVAAVRRFRARAAGRRR